MLGVSGSRFIGTHQDIQGVDKDHAWRIWVVVKIMVPS